MDNNGRQDDREIISNSVAALDELPVAPSMDLARAASLAPRRPILVDRRVILISVLAIGVALVSGVIARVLTALIGFVTNLCYYGRFSTSFASPAHHHLGPIALIIPAIGGVIVGLMARYGSAGIRGHGIPEAMEQVLVNQSRIPPRLTFLKPLSAAIAIGTGGPFGAEGPIIATGGALGSLVGQLMRTTAMERKTLLAAGAAAGMTATFGCPIAAVILAIELLLFEFRPRSLIPVTLASVAATGVRYAFVGSAPMFPMHAVASPGGAAITFYVLLGVVIGCVSVYVTRLVYGIEDGFDRLPVHWMWWPALGGLVVGVIGLAAPHTLGVGYDNIEHIVSGSLLGGAVLFLCVMKLVSWSISLGSGTSGGTLAPLFTIGGGLGAAIGGLAAKFLPFLGVDLRVAALVGMAAIFAGASRAVLASIVFAFETTLQPMAILPLMGGCIAAYLISCLMMRDTIMTEKISRRGIRVPSEYAADFLDQVLVRDVAQRDVVSLQADDTLEKVRTWIGTEERPAKHQGFPVLDSSNRLIGVVTRRDLLDPKQSGTASVRALVKRPPAIAYEDNSLREAADHMVRESVGRLPVVSRDDPRQVTGIITRSDLLSAHARRLEETDTAIRNIRIRTMLRRVVRNHSG